MQNNFQKFKKVPLIAATSLLIVPIVFYIFIYNNIQKNAEAYNKEEVEWQIKNAKKEEIKAITKELQMIEKERSLLNTHFIQSSDVVPFLDTVEQLAQKVNTQAEITQVDISSDKTSLAISVNASGSFQNLYKFLTLLENSPYQIEFTSVNLERNVTGAVSKNAGEWSATFTIKLLSFLN